MPLSPKQRQALKASTHPINVWYGSVRSSKTYGSLWALIRAVTEYDGRGTIVIVGLNRDTIWRNIFVPLFTEPDFKIIADTTLYRQGAATAKILGVDVHVIGANDERAWMRIQGMTIAFCLGDEAVTWPQSFWDMLLTRLSLPTSRLLVTCNPGPSNHYLKTNIIDRADTDPDIHIEKFLLTDNPSLSPAYIDRLQRTYTGIFYRRMILAEWVAAEGAIYEDWNPDTMTIQPSDIPGLVDTLALGIDYGTTHPTVGILLALGDDGRLYAVDEWHPTRSTDYELSRDLHGWITRHPYPQWTYLDPAAASFRLQLQEQDWDGLAKAKNSVLDGIRTVGSLLTNGQLKISTTCTKLLDELPSYRWDAKKAQNGIDAPIKEGDDACDALRYAVYSSRWLWADRIRAGDPPHGQNTQPLAPTTL